MESLHTPVVLGTARQDRKSAQVAELVSSVIAEHDGMSSELVDVRDHVTTAVTVPPWGVGGADEQSNAWQDIMQRSQALVLVVPEYNHGYPGELKLLLDSLYEDYKGKPVGLVGVSTGSLGGARVIEHIKPVLIELGLHPIRDAVTFMKVGDAFAEDGSLINENFIDYITSMLDELRVTAAAFASVSEGNKQ